jgi:hypothetical protein
MFTNMNDHRMAYRSTKLAPKIAAAEGARPDFDLEDMQTHLEQLQTQVADCELIRDLTTTGQNVIYSRNFRSTSGFLRRK